ncbi:hypothetical protein EDD15DRAFT_2370455 [Pisolithus albus]|nr:hypothetical protein EDD15DRAFT_2370455 [Pisolithus albus]
MGPKPKPKLTSNTNPANDVAGGTRRRSQRSARGTRGALRQLELIENIQTAAREPQNAEMRRIKETLSQQPENPFAPPKLSRKKAKGPDIPYVLSVPPSPVLPKKRLAGSKESFGFYDGRDFSLPPFTQPDSRSSPSRRSSEQEEDGGIEGITEGVADLGSEDREMADPRCDEDGQQTGVAQGASSHSETVLEDGSAEESDELRRKRFLDPNDEIGINHEAHTDEVLSPVNHGLPTFRKQASRASQSSEDNDDHPPSSRPPRTSCTSAPVFLPPHKRTALTGKRCDNPTNIQAHNGAFHLPNTKAPARQTIPKPNSFKCPATSPVAVQRKAAKNSSTIASRGRGGGAISTSSRQVLEAHDGMDPEAPCDVLLDHHRHNGMPCAPTSTYLASLATKSKTDSTVGPPAAAADADDEIENPATAEPCTGSSNDPMTLKFYDPVWRTVLSRAKVLSRFDAVITNAFPEWQLYISKKALEFITQAIAELEEDGVQPDESFLRKHQYHMSDLLFEDLGTFRSDFKKIARQVVARHWDWEPDNFDGPQELADHVLELYNYLTEETKYIHGDHDEEGKFNNFSSAALRDLCVTGYYIGKSSLVASFSDIFSKHFPTGALAFAATALTAAMDEYATGALIAIKFRHEGYLKVNEQFLEIIANIEAVPHRF